MDQRFHGPPPLKRFRLVWQQQKDALLSPLHILGKKRNALRDQLILPDLVASAATISPILCLPRKWFGRFSSICFPESTFRHWTLMLSTSYILGRSRKKRWWRKWRKWRSADEDPSDLIVFCDGCDLMVHASYYGNPLVKDPEGREGINCSMVLKRRWKERCYVCESSRGCAIQWSELKCPLAFHVSCGLNKDLCIEYKDGMNKGAIATKFHHLNNYLY
ncbi:uncharacterized protein [Pyrus communis]|uniref:uncharacterized protein n=1 Tax=Pyrus communis TaxID=23211 RepID=UPI0035BF5D0D